MLSNISTLRMMKSTILHRRVNDPEAVSVLFGKAVRKTCRLRSMPHTLSGLPIVRMPDDALPTNNLA